jgi:DnaJ-class molecular chaperone
MQLALLHRGRTNMVDRAMLPKAVWPEWCEYCRGAGKCHCERCNGMGNFRQKFGFDMDGDD